MKIRNPNAEIRKKSEARSRARLISSGFGLLSDFGIRLSGFISILAVCTMSAAFAQVPSGTNATPVTTASTNTAASAPRSLSGYVPDDKYKLRVGDRISLQIVEDRDLPKSLVVADSGELDVPYIGRVAATDKTCKQLADELKADLEKEYYYRATVIIALDVANKVLGRIYIWGQVKNAGPLDLAVNENLTVSKAILRAGGFGDFANRKKVQLIRGIGMEGFEKHTWTLNMVEILEDGKTEKDILLEPDDSIIIPARTFNF